MLVQRSPLIRLGTIVFWLAVGTLMPALLGTNPLRLGELEFIVALVLAGISLNIALGFAGQLFVGPSAFMSIAGFTGAVLADHYASITGVWGLVIMFAAGIMASLIVSAVIATLTLRVSGFYFAMVSFFLALLIPDVTQYWSLTGGANGIVLVSIPTFNQQPSGVALYEVGIGLIAVMALYMWLIKNSRLGRRFGAIAASEELAQSCGVSPYPTKLAAFLLAAVPVGLAGGFFTYSQQIMTPNTLPIQISIYIMAGVVVGGAGTILGPIIGTALVGAGTQFLGSFAQYQGLIYGALLVVVAVGMPTGIIGLWRNLTIPVLKRWGLMAEPRPPAVQEPVATPGDKVSVPLERRLVQRFRVPEVPRSDLVEAVDGGKGQVDGAPTVQGTPKDGRGRGLDGKQLVVHGAARSFGGVQAVDGVDFILDQGTVHALVGPNGSGKTTLLNLICGYYRVDRGTISIGDTKLNELRSVAKVARLGVARSFQTPKLNSDETVLSNVMLGADRMATGSVWLSILHLPKARRNDKVGAASSLHALISVAMRDQWSAIASLVPHGTQRLLELARVQAFTPSFVLLDEPAAGLSAAETAVLKQAVRGMADNGIGVLLVEHNLPVVFDVADKITVLHDGRVIAEGTPAEVSRDPEVIRVYIGRAPDEQAPESVPTGGTQ